MMKTLSLWVRLGKPLYNCKEMILYQDMSTKKQEQKSQRC